MTNVNSVIIVGGGTAGWLSALYLQKQLSRFGSGPNIQVFDSSEVGIIGVGEATVHSIRYFLQELDLSESAFMAATNATFKLGIKFENWRKSQNDEPHSYWHPFDAQLAKVNGFDVSEIWNYARLNGFSIPYAEQASMSPTLAEHNRSPKTSTDKDFEANIPYAYHFDAAKAAEFFKAEAQKRGITHHNKTIEDVLVDGEKVISLVSQNEQYSADFYIDCSGFNQLLISKLADNNWHSYEQELPCNRAVAIQTDYQAEQQPNLYTRSIALNQGWCWQIHLQSRIGNGYVYDGNRLTPEQAEAELRDFLAITNDVPAKHLKMKIGRNKASWIGNCAAIGLSGGFIEPLESTGIYLIEAGLRRLMDFGLIASPKSSQTASFNSFMADLYDELRDFIVLHYCLTDRDDTEFWRTRADTVTGLPKLQQLIELAKIQLINDRDIGSQACLFNQINYRFVLLGMDCLPEHFHPAMQGLELGQAKHLLQQLSAFYQKQLHQHQ